MIILLIYLFRCTLKELIEIWENQSILKLHKIFLWEHFDYNLYSGLERKNY